MTEKIHWPFEPSVETQPYEYSLLVPWRLTGFDFALAVHNNTQPPPLARVRSLEDARQLLAETRVRGVPMTEWCIMKLVNAGGRLTWETCEEGRI